MNGLGPAQGKVAAVVWVDCAYRRVIDVHAEFFSWSDEWAIGKGGALFTYHLHGGY